MNEYLKLTIIELLDKKGMTRGKLAKLIKYGRGYTYDVLSKNSDVQLTNSFILPTCEVLGITEFDLYKEALKKAGQL